MATKLRYFMDDLISGVPESVKQYGLELASALVATAPDDCQVEGIIAKRPATQIDELRAGVPELQDITQLRVPGKELKTALMRGHGGRLVPPGLVHSPTFLGPMYQRRRRGPFHQTVVTWHASLADVELPQTPTGRASKTAKTYLERIDSFADAVVVSTQAEADMLSDQSHLGERIHIVPAAPALKFTGKNPGSVAAALGVKTKYFLVYAPDAKQRKQVLAALKLTKKPLHVIMVTDDDTADTAVNSARVTTVKPTSEQLSALIAHAALVFYLAPVDRTLFSVMDVMANGAPLAYLKTAQLDEITGATGIAIPKKELSASRIAQVMDATARTRKLPGQLRLSAGDRIELFNWKLTASQIWQLHADL